MRIVTNTLKDIIDFYNNTGSCVFYMNNKLTTEPELSPDQVDKAIYDGEFWTVDDLKLKVFLLTELRP